MERFPRNGQNIWWYSSVAMMYGIFPETYSGNNVGLIKNGK